MLKNIESIWKFYVVQSTYVELVNCGFPFEDQDKLYERLRALHPVVQEATKTREDIIKLNAEINEWFNKTLTELESELK